MAEEQIILVDDTNRQIGVAPKLASHHAATPLHRAFSCFVFNARGEFLITQRALSKKVFPGIWSNSCCGHPAPGENTEDAVRRRLRDELGLNVDTLLPALPDFRYRAEMNGIVENEICPVYVAVTNEEPRAKSARKWKPGPGCDGMNSSAPSAGPSGELVLLERQGNAGIARQ